MDYDKQPKVVVEGEVVETSEPIHTLPDDEKSPEHQERVRAVKRNINQNLSMISKSNDLIQKTRYSLSKTQQKIRLAMISKIDTKRDTDCEKIYTMTFSEFSKLTGTDMQNNGNKQYMMDVLASLASSVFWMDIRDEHNEKNKLFRWIGDEAEIDNKAREIHIQFSKSIFPYLTQLKSNYTTFNVEFLLHMTSNYSMRVYEILKSYDNGDVNYGYTNNIVFQQVTEDILDKFHDKANDIRGYKYKVFDIEELKEQLSPAPGAPEDPKTRPLTEKYANFGDFERHVLKRAKDEIDLMTDLWFNYIPVRVAGQGRSFKRVYLFIKYKTDKEMEVVYKRIKDQELDDEAPRRSKATTGMDNSIRDILTNTQPDESRAEDAGITLFTVDVHSTSPTRALREIEAKAEFVNIQSQINDPDLVSAISGAFTYTSRLLTNTKNEKKAQMARTTRDALNRIIERDKTLKYWAVGMGDMLKRKNEAGLLKSPQYNATVVFNAIEDYQVLQNGKQIYEKIESGKPDMFKQNWMNQFESE